MPSNARIFISFASQDVKVAFTICKALESRGFRCWISSRDILPGENFQVAIVRAIRAARMMLLVFTANSNNSEEMTKELVLASQNKLIVVPLRIEDVTPNEAFSYEFATRQWIDFFADWETAMNQLSDRIGSAISPEAAEPVRPAPSTSLMLDTMDALSRRPEVEPDAADTRALAEAAVAAAPEPAPLAAPPPASDTGTVFMPAAAPAEELVAVEGDHELAESIVAEAPAASPEPAAAAEEAWPQIHEAGEKTRFMPAAEAHAEPHAPATASAPEPAPAARKGAPVALLAALGVLVLALAGGGYWAYTTYGAKLFAKGAPPPAPHPTAATPVSTPPVTTTPVAIAPPPAIVATPPATNPAESVTTTEPTNAAATNALASATSTHPRKHTPKPAAATIEHARETDVPF